MFFGWGFGCARPPLAGVLGCACLCACSPCAARLLAGVSRRGCVCLVSGFGCAPPLLAGVLGCVCARVRAPLVPRHSWLGCAVWVWVFGLGFQLRPATPGWGVWVCVFVCVLPLYPATPGWGVQSGCRCLGSGLGCAPPPLAGVLGCAWLCAFSPCTPPLLAGVCGVRVCVWVLVSAAIRHSWLGCWGVCVLVSALRLYPATPGWGVRCGCGCLSSDFGCAPPLLAGVLGCACLCACSPCTPSLLAGVCGVRVCVWVWVSAAPRHSWLGCWGVCVLVSALSLYPATPGWGVRRVCVCLGSCFGCAPPLLAGVLRGVCAAVRALLVPRHSWLGCAAWECVFGLGFRLRPATPGWRFGVCVFVCVLPLYPVTSGRGVRRACVCLGSGFRCALPLLAGLLGCVCAVVHAPLVPRHSWLGCAVWVCVFGLEFPLRPATPGLGVGVCLCWCPPSACNPPLLAGVCGVCVCFWARVSAAPHRSWLGCLGGVCARVRAPLVPRHSWLGCAAWVCVFRLGLRLHPATPGWVGGGCVFVCVLPLYPATPGWGVRPGSVWLGSGFGCSPATPCWGVGVCGWWCGRSPCTPPLLAGVCGAAVGVWARVSAAPRHSWLGCGGVCLLVCAPGWHPATPGSGVRLGCGFLGWGFGCARPLLAGMLGCACLCACSPCTAQLLAGVCGVGVCAWFRVSAAPRHSWLGCWGVFVHVCALRLYPATPGWGVWCGWGCLG